MFFSDPWNHLSLIVPLLPLSSPMLFSLFTTDFPNASPSRSSESEHRTGHAYRRFPKKCLDCFYISTPLVPPAENLLLALQLGAKL